MVEGGGGREGAVSGQAIDARGRLKLWHGVQQHWRSQSRQQRPTRVVAVRSFLRFNFALSLAACSRTTAG